MELWRDIRGYEGLYQVSNYGRVRSLKYGKIKILKQVKKPSKHLIVTPSKNNVKEECFVHVLVATAFIPNPNGYTVVHHIDHDPTNNRVENLIWMDKDAHLVLHQSDRASAAKEANSKRVDQIDKVTGEVLRQWDSVMDAARALNYSFGNISQCCNGKRKSANNFIWKYVSN